MKIVIVGGVAGGASAATRARRLDENAEIVMFERGPDVSFANCGMPYFVGDVIQDRNRLLVTTAERLRQRFRLDVRVQHEVTKVNPVGKTVVYRNLATGMEGTETYDKLILATGASPIIPEFPGSKTPGIYTLRALDDADQLKSVLDRGHKRFLIVGAGFIGIELAENIIHRGGSVTLVDLSTYILAALDPEMTTQLVQELKSKGVNIKLGATISQASHSDQGIQISLSNGETQNVDAVVLGVGVKPENQLAATAKITIGRRGGIIVNIFMQTSDPDIYAVGDVVESTDFQTGKAAQVPLAGPANRQGRLAANHIFGSREGFRGHQSTAIVGFFDLVAATTGASEQKLRRDQIDFRKVYIHPSQHAGYYPGAEAMTLKLLFAPHSGTILGAQGIGRAGVDKRIDVLAVAIQAKMTVFQLEESELCYAPQFGSAKDPINMLGFVAAGLLRGEHPQIQWEDYAANCHLYQLIDVRTPSEYASGHVDGAINFPLDELRSHSSEFELSKNYAIYCQVGQRGYVATRILMAMGMNVVNLSGGYKTWEIRRILGI